MRSLVLSSLVLLAACARNECPPAAAGNTTTPVATSSACEVGPRNPVHEQSALLDTSDVINLDPERMPAATPEAIELIKDALRADQAGDLQTCIAKDRAALQLGESSRTTLHLSSCESRSGKLVDALRDAQRSLEIGIRQSDVAVMKIARRRLQELIRQVPHVQFVQAEDTDVMRLTFDEHPVPTEARAKRFSVDPGEHRIRLEGKRAGKPFEHQCTFTVAVGENVPVHLHAQ